MANARPHRQIDSLRRPAARPDRNPGLPLELDWVRGIGVNRSAVERRAATIGTRRTVKKEWQAAWLLRAVTLMDLTTLSGDDTPGYVRRLCAKAVRPVRADLMEALGKELRPLEQEFFAYVDQLPPEEPDWLKQMQVDVIMRKLRVQREWIIDMHPFSMVVFHV